MTPRLTLHRIVAVCVLAGTALTAKAVAGVKLITLPPRERVEIQLDNVNVTLVEEERVIPLAAGLNDVVFAWANTNIDKSSIQFRCLTDPDNIKVLSVSYPPGEKRNRAVSVVLENPCLTGHQRELAQTVLFIVGENVVHRDAKLFLRGIQITM